jgi:signal transduction histidine kinase
LPNDAIDALCESRDGTLWIGTDDVSIAEYDPSSNIFRRHIPDYAKSGGVGAGVIAILEDHTGMIWCAIPPMGLNSYDRSSDRWTQFVRDARAGNVPSSDVAPGTLSLCEDRGGTIWVGTDEGLYKFERETGTFTRFSVKDGLADNVINAILEDERDCLWLCTARGLSRFDPRNGSFRNYDAGDGVTVGQFRPSTGYRNRKGEMFFGGSNGFIRFHPDSIKDNLYVPPIVITAFKKFDKLVSLDSAISETRHVELSYKENVFSFEFAALNYSATEKNQYAYKLEGFDNDWIYCGTRRYATYTNLDGGSYIFRVKGSNNDGIWNEEGTSIAVIITPPFWKTWWFTIMFWLTIAGSTGGTIRYVEIRKLKGKLERLEQQQALARVRLRISEDMHDEVGATLTQISILSELARKEGEGSGESADHIKRISEKSREVVDNIGEIIWAIDPNNDHLENLVAYLRQYTFQYFKSSPIQCRLEAPDDLAPLSMSAQARRNIFLVCKESMHNVIKHSQAAEFTLTLRQSPLGLEILMKDDGKGFSTEEHSGLGNGLRNMKRRMEEVGGILKIESGPGQGTLTVLTVPLREDPLSGRGA